MMKVKRLAGAIGAELSGIDLRDAAFAQQVANIRQAFLEHQVVFFRDQPLTPAQYLRFAHALGEPIDYPFVAGIDGFPKIIEVKKLEHERNNFGGIWHSDTTYLEVPPMASMLLALEIPPQGGDTLFASQYAAYEALSDTMQRLLTGLIGISSSAKADVSMTREDRIKSSGREDSRAEYRAEHPIIRTHPETGRQSIYVNTAHTVGIKGLSDAEAKPLLEFLFAHQVKPEFTCRFSWQVASIALWDNRCALHNPVNDYHGFRRVMHRITLAGDRPR